LKEGCQNVLALLLICFKQIVRRCPYLFPKTIQVEIADETIDPGERGRLLSIILLDHATPHFFQEALILGV